MKSAELHLLLHRKTLPPLGRCQRLPSLHLRLPPSRDVRIRMHHDPVDRVGALGGRGARSEGGGRGDRTRRRSDLRS